MAAPSAGLASSERGDTVARLRTANWMTTVGYLALVGVLLFVIATQDQQRREAIDAKQAATEEVADLRFQLDCRSVLQADWSAALLAYIVALNSGDGAAVARVDAELATARWQEAQQRCATR